MLLLNARPLLPTNTLSNEVQTRTKAVVYASPRKIKVEEVP